MDKKKLLKRIISIALILSIGFAIVTFCKNINSDDYFNAGLNKATIVLINGQLQIEEETPFIKEWKKNIIEILKSNYEEIDESFYEINSIILDVKVDNYEENNDYQVTIIVLTKKKPGGFSVFTKFTGYWYDLPTALQSSKEEMKRQIRFLKFIQSK